MICKATGAMMLSVKRAASVIIVVALIVCVSEVASKPYQELLPKPGYVPVYIREGNTPLSKINPQLAEAFHELEVESMKVAENTNGKNETQPADAGEIYTGKNVKSIDESKPTTESDIASFDVIKKTT